MVLANWFEIYFSAVAQESEKGGHTRLFRYLKAFSACETLQFPGMIRVAGEEEDLASFCEGSDGLDGGGAAGERGLTIDD
jgi:hypothetical protein